jgi:hypothetical protein
MPFLVAVVTASSRPCRVLGALPVPYISRIMARTVLLCLHHQGQQLSRFQGPLASQPRHNGSWMSRDMTWGRYS